MNQQDPSLLTPGTRIDRYTVMAVLGRGGFGITYLVRDEALGQDFALKEFFPEDLVWRDGVEIRVAAKASSESDYRWGLEKFYDEARVLAQFSHPNIVHVRRVFEANNTAYMLLDFINGSTLEKWLQRLESPPTQEELDLIATPLLSALHLAHTNRTWHLDFSPENVMIRASDGMPILLDFGAARFEIKQHSQLVSALVFKSGYSAPEQYTSSASRYGPWTDIYAFGCTLYRAIAGERPTEATSRQLRDEQRPAALVARGPYREGFLKAVDWAMKLPLEERPQSIREWRRALFDTSRSTVASRSAPVMTRVIPEEPRSEPPRERPVRVVERAAPEPAPAPVRRRARAGRARRFVAWVVALTGIAVILSVGATRMVPALNLLSRAAPSAEAAECDRESCWLAIVEKDAGVFARMNGPTRADAENAALNLCSKKMGTGCRVVAVVPKGSCWALAESTTSRSNRRSASGATLEVAQSQATVACERAYRGTCRIEVTLCTDGNVILRSG